jgi:hypothetical protein
MGVAGLLEPIDIQRDSTPSALRLYAPPTDWPPPASPAAPAPTAGTTPSLATALAALVVYSSAMTLQEDPERVHGKGRKTSGGFRNEDMCPLTAPPPAPRELRRASDVAWTLNDPPLRPARSSFRGPQPSQWPTISKRSVRRLSGTAVCWDRRAGNVHIFTLHPTISTPTNTDYRPRSSHRAPAPGYPSV